MVCPCHALLVHPTGIAIMVFIQLHHALLVHPTGIAIMVFIQLHLKKQTTKTTNNQSQIHGENPTKQEKQMHKNTQQQMLKH